MTDVVRFDTIMLASDRQEAEFETFVRDRLFPAMKSAYGGHLTRKTIASLADQTLLKAGCNGSGYIWMSVWSGPLEALSDRDFRRVFMGEIEEVKAALGALDSLGRREEPRVYQKLT